MNLIELVPQSSEGWKLSKVMPIPTTNELFEYINGGAELYISYGSGSTQLHLFKGRPTRHYSRYLRSA
jgi:hypothetical protein